MPLVLLDVKMVAMFSQLGRRTVFLLLLIILVAFSLRELSLDAQSMWRDEVDTLCFAFGFWDVLAQARAPVASEISAPSLERLDCQPVPGLSLVDASQGLWAALRALLTLPGWNGPLYTLAMRPWIELAGSSSFALRYSSLFFGLLAVPLTFVLGRRLVSTGAGLIGAVLVAFSPHLVWYSQEVKMYGLLLALGLLAIYSLRRALESRQSARWWVLMVAATTIAFYMHILAVLLIPLEVVLGGIWWPRTRRHWRGALVALAVLTVPYLPLLVWQVRSWMRPAGEATLFTVDRLDVMLRATVEGWAGNFVGEPWMTLILAGLVLLALFGTAGAGLAGSGEGGRRYGWRVPLALWTWIAIPFIGIWFISTRQPIFTNRYLVWAAPALYLLVAAGAVVLWRQGRGGAWLAGGLLLLVLVGNGRALVHQIRQPIKPDFRAAANYLEARYQPGDLIIFHLSYVEQNLDYYFKGEYEGWGAPAPASGWSESDLDFRMRTHVSGHHRVWLVLSQSDMWDPQGRVKAWLDVHAAGPLEEAHFAHVSVYRYEPGDRL